jgi:hypothetical protein
MRAAAGATKILAKYQTETGRAIRAYNSRMANAASRPNGMLSRARS